MPVGEAGVAVPLFVTAEVPIGLVVDQVKVPLEQLELPDGIVHEAVAGLSVPVIWVNVAVTVQFAFTGEVV